MFNAEMQLIFKSIRSGMLIGISKKSRKSPFKRAGKYEWTNYIFQMIKEAVVQANTMIGISGK